MGRFGYAIDSVLLYVTGGAAFGEIRHRYDRYDLNSGTGAYDFVAAQRFTHKWTGWILGAGMEYALAPGWTTRVEYRYTDFGVMTDHPTLYAPPQVFTERHREEFHSLRVGVAYRF